MRYLHSQDEGDGALPVAVLGYEPPERRNLVEFWVEAAGLGATLGPALRGLRIQLMEALREE